MDAITQLALYDEITALNCLPYGGGQFIRNYVLWYSPDLEDEVRAVLGKDVPPMGLPPSHATTGADFAIYPRQVDAFRPKTWRLDPLK